MPSRMSDTGLFLVSTHPFAESARPAHRRKPRSRPLGFFSS